jgi:transposase
MSVRNLVEEFSALEDPRCGKVEHRLIDIRLDTAMLMRVFLGWLRGERGHCSMVAVPSIDEEDAKRPSRERENLVGERTRIINRMKSALVRFGIRGFKPELRRAPQRLADLRTPEDLPIPPNTLDELRRDLARLALVRNQIETIERVRLERLQQAPKTGTNAMVLRSTFRIFRKDPAHSRVSYHGRNHLTH